jgi:hypothetical protein
LRNVLIYSCYKKISSNQYLIYFYFDDNKENEHLSTNFALKCVGTRNIIKEIRLKASSKCSQDPLHNKIAEGKHIWLLQANKIIV